MFIEEGEEGEIEAVINTLIPKANLIELFIRIREQTLWESREWRQQDTGKGKKRSVLTCEKSQLEILWYETHELKWAFALGIKKKD